MSKYLALEVSDLHISDKPPIARAVGDTEEERRKRWRRAMGRHLDQLHKLSAENGFIPIIAAGDIFDTPYQPASIVNWLLSRIPDNIKWHGVPGQHDLPNHQLGRIRESCYWTLVEAGKLTNIEPNHPVEVSGTTPLRLHGFPYGVPIKPLERDHTSMMCLEIAVIHRYIWTKDKGYPGAPEENELLTYADKVRGYDVAIFGDNHQHFQVSARSDGFLPLTLWNCGGFMRRNADEKHRRPCIGLLRKNGTIKRHFLDVSRDKWNDREPRVESNGEVDVSGLVKEIRTGQEAVSYSEAVTRWLRKHHVSEGARQEITEAMEEK